MAGGRAGRHPEPGRPQGDRRSGDDLIRGARLVGERRRAGPGELVLKPRGQWHAFWNPGQDRARLLEIISPAGFEQFFQEVGQYYSSERDMDLERFMAACDRYALEMDLESVPELIGRFGLVAPPEMTSGGG
ncbi:cupin domain-containing protein [Kocuria sp. NPDC057446]|uniref:cupin domain-containing protein n=1 Tax=Kocuria sp. NPDC057446 TaxID=3346137 RepID=UPI0036A807F7